MKLLMNACAVTALIWGVAGQAGAQIQVRTAPIHAVPPDSGPDDAASAPSVGTLGASDAAVGRAVAAITGSPAGDAPLLNPQESAFFVVLGRRLTDAAAAYEAYVRLASAIDARFADPAMVQSALGVAESYNAAQLQEGAIAYAAILALRSQEFVDSVRAQGDRELADELIARPDAVYSIHGAYEAAADVSGVMKAQAQAVKAAGQAISNAAYSVQHQAWSRSAVAQPDQVLAAAKASASRLSAADARSERRLLDSIAAASGDPGAGRASSAEVTRGLALAAVAILGGVGDAQESRFEPLLREWRNADCLQMAKMNLNQCLAVAGPQYEDVFCMGRHAVGETAQCLISAVDEDQLPQGERTAQLDGYGAERAEAYAEPSPGR